MAVRTELTVRATHSKAIQFQLLSGSAPIDLSSIGTVEMTLRDKSGGTAVFGNLGNAKLTINGASSGSVQFVPGTADLLAGSAPYNGYFRLFASASQWYYVPSDHEFTISVRELF